MARKFTKYPSKRVVAASDNTIDNTWKIAEDIKHAVFDGDDTITEFVSFAGDGCSFIVTDGESEYRIRVSKEI